LCGGGGIGDWIGVGDGFVMIAYLRNEYTACEI